MNRYALILIFFISFLAIQGQQKSPPLKLKVDSSYVQKKSFDQKRILEYLETGDFDYSIPEKEPSIFERVWIWIKRALISFLELLFDDIGPALSFLGTFLKLLPYLILVIALVLIVKFFMNVSPKAILKTNDTKITQFSTDEELIESHKLENMLEMALNDKDFRMAIRFYYLMVLRKLSNENRIDWKPEKTNYDYIRELTESPVLSDFVKSTRLYDFVWYGKFTIDEGEFYKQEISFKNLLNN